MRAALPTTSRPRAPPPRAPPRGANLGVNAKTMGRQPSWDRSVAGQQEIGQQEDRDPLSVLDRARGADDGCGGVERLDGKVWPGGGGGGGGGQRNRGLKARLGSVAHRHEGGGGRSREHAPRGDFGRSIPAGVHHRPGARSPRAARGSGTARGRRRYHCYRGWFHRLSAPGERVGPVRLPVWRQVSVEEHLTGGGDLREVASL